MRPPDSWRVAGGDLLYFVLSGSRDRLRAEIVCHWRLGSVYAGGVRRAYPRGEEENLARIIGARKATSHERRRYEAEAP